MNLEDIFPGFPDSSVGKESACNAGDLGSILGLGRSPGEGKGYPLQYSGLENSMDCIVHRVSKSQTRLRDFHFSLCPSLPVSTSLLCIFYQRASSYRIQMGIKIETLNSFPIMTSRLQFS